MSFERFAALFGAMMTLALIPSPSVALVVARAIASGFAQGAAIALGIVLGDFVFILLALSGLAAIAETLDSVLIWVNYLGALYLIWLGVSLWRAQGDGLDLTARPEHSWFANLACGFWVTISDPKAIVFYVSFFPAFVDLSNLSIREIAMILAIAAISVGGAKCVYAYLGHRSRQWLSHSIANLVIPRIAAIVMIGTGVLLVTKS